MIRRGSTPCASRKVAQGVAQGVESERRSGAALFPGLGGDGDFDPGFFHESFEPHGQTAHSADGFPTKGRENRILRFSWRTPDEPFLELGVYGDFDEPLGFGLAETETQALGIIVFSLQVGQIAEAGSGVESGEDQALPLFVGRRQELGDIGGGENSFFHGVGGDHIHRLGGIVGKQALAAGHIQGAAQDLDGDIGGRGGASS